MLETEMMNLNHYSLTQVRVVLNWYVPAGRTPLLDETLTLASTFSSSRGSSSFKLPLSIAVAISFPLEEVSSTSANKLPLAKSGASVIATLSKEKVAGPLDCISAAPIALNLLRSESPRSSLVPFTKQALGTLPTASIVAETSALAPVAAPAAIKQALQPIDRNRKRFMGGDPRKGEDELTFIHPYWRRKGPNTPISLS